MKPLKRFGHEWFALYAVAWQARWPSVRRGVVVQDKGAFSTTPGDPNACALMAAQDADEGIDAFNDTFCKEKP